MPDRSPTASRPTTPRRVALCTLWWAALSSAAVASGVDMSPGQAVRIGGDALLADHPRSHFPRTVNFAPVGGETVRLNPPRFRWAYYPPEAEVGPQEFVFQIARDPPFRQRVVDVRTPYNFYNTLKPLPAGGPLYWRVGTCKGGQEPFHWSGARVFHIAPDATVWDRSMLAEPDFASRPHPRILLGGDNRSKILRLAQTDADAKAILAAIRDRAKQAMASDWWRDFPATDTKPAQASFLSIAHDLCHVAFLLRLTGEKQYAGVIERAAVLAGYPKGGRSSPEPMGESNEDSTQITELLALLYDWLRPDLSAEQRKAFVGSLDWRTDHFVNNFAWKSTRAGKQAVPKAGSLSTWCGSHHFEGFWDTFPAAIACYEESPAARECFDLGVNWLAGVSCGHGFDEGWSAGPGYGNSKFRWLMHSSMYLDSVFPEYKLGTLPWYQRVGEWFARMTPVGLKHAPFGHGSNRAAYYTAGRSDTFRSLAYLTGSGLFLRNWRETSGGDVTGASRLWIQLALPLLHPKPAERLEEDPVGLFPLAGWVMAGTQPPSSPAAYRESVGMIFKSSPAGAYNHGFCAENSFHIYGYGQDLSHAAGASIPEPYSTHSMSHNTVLIDGIGQVQKQWEDRPRLAFLRAFQRGEGYVYWAGDATGAYPATPSCPRGYWGRFDDIYNQRDAGHLRRFIRHVVFLRGKYFVIFDDLSAAKPATFSWLYHILPADPIAIDTDTATIDYRVGDVPVRIVHVGGRDQLDILDLTGDEGFRNPMTGEDYRVNAGRARGQKRPADLVAGHNLWVSNKARAEDFHFLAVIAPARPGAKPPAIERIDDRTVRVGDDVISFDPGTAHRANLVIDVPALRATPPKPKWYVPPQPVAKEP